MAYEAVSQNRAPQNGPQYTIIRFLGTLTRGTPNFGENPRKHQEAMAQGLQLSTVTWSRILIEYVKGYIGVVGPI